MTPTQTMRDQCEVVLTRISLQLVIVRKPLPLISIMSVFLFVLHARSPSSLWTLEAWVGVCRVTRRNIFVARPRKILPNLDRVVASVGIFVTRSGYPHDRWVAIRLASIPSSWGCFWLCHDDRRDVRHRHRYHTIANRTLYFDFHPKLCPNHCHRHRRCLLDTRQRSIEIFRSVT